MDELTASLASSFRVSYSPNTTAAAHPRFSQYKNNAKITDHASRRRCMLEQQKQQRFDYMKHVRRLAGDVWGDMADLPDEDVDESMDCETLIEKKRPWRPGKFYKNQLMLSEWLVDEPEDFQDEWMMVLCPVGKRCLVVTDRGKTKVYSKGGWHMNTFQSHLPGGCRQHGFKMKETVLDCIYSEVSKIFYILDVMCWNGNPVVDSETDFRFYWIHTKTQENPEILETSKLNPFKFIALPNFACDKENITSVMEAPLTAELDGLLFYHKRTHYTFGSTPLVLWLKAYMLPELLGVPVPEKYAAQRPAQYTGREYHLEMARKYKEKEEARAKGKKSPRQGFQLSPAAHFSMNFGGRQPPPFTPWSYSSLKASGSGSHRPKQRSAKKKQAGETEGKGKPSTESQQSKGGGAVYTGIDNVIQMEAQKQIKELEERLRRLEEKAAKGERDSEGTVEAAQGEMETVTEGEGAAAVATETEQATGGTQEEVEEEGQMEVAEGNEGTPGESGEAKKKRQRKKKGKSK